MNRFRDANRMIRLAPFVAAAVGFSAVATSFLVRPFTETVDAAPILARGTVGSSHTRWAQGGGTERIYTYTEFEIVEVLKGDLGDSRNVTVRELGGEKDGVAMDVGGTAKFQRGEDNVLMLRGPNPDGSYDVRGLMMGKLTVSVDESGEEVLSGPALDSPGVKNDHELSHNGTGEGQNSDAKWTLDRLRELIRAQERASGDSQDPAPKEHIPAQGKREGPPQIQASALQPEEGERGPRAEYGLQEESSEISSPFSFRFLGFALTAILILGVLMAVIIKGKRD